MLAQFIHDTKIDFMKRKFQNFFKFFSIFLSFFDTLHEQKDFCTFEPKIIYFYILGGQHVHLTSRKCFLEAYPTKCPGNARTRQGRVKKVFHSLRSMSICSAVNSQKYIYSMLIFSNLFCKFHWWTENKSITM